MRNPAVKHRSPEGLNQGEGFDNGPGGNSNDD